MNFKRIIQLDPLISNQIAAGEVVERPASVVKELIENAIDANATKIEIEIEGGGIHLIRVRDNGHGIDKNDLELAFCRHATSKIKTTQDLESIISLGFRGEALASIVSVSKCRLLSKSNGSSDAWQINIHPDLSASITLGSHSVGTTIEVADLFYNTPVRRKFLRSEKSESLAIEETIKRLALSYPHITFIYKQNQKLIRQYIGANHAASIEERVAKICGQAFMEQAVSLTLESDTLRLHGWMGCPTLARRQADCQFLFVNRRTIKDRLLSHAIKSLYQQHPEHIEGTYPAYVLFLELDPTEVDVNVHPTKQEVRFSQARMIHDFVSKGIQQAWAEPSTPIKIQASSPTRVSKIQTRISEIVPVSTEKKYLLLETPSGVQIIDVQREKITLFTRFFEKHRGQFPKKYLLFPLRIKRSVLGVGAENIIQVFADYGFECSYEGEWVSIYQQPIFLPSPIMESQFLALLHKFNQHPSLEALSKSLFSLFSENALSTLDWTSVDLTNIPSVCLSHEAIEKALDV